MPKILVSILLLFKLCTAYDGIYQTVYPSYSPFGPAPGGAIVGNVFQNLKQGTKEAARGIVGGTMSRLLLGGVPQQILQSQVTLESGPNLYQRKQAEATINALKNEEKITDLNKQARNISDTYKQIQEEIAAPLEGQTAALKQERNILIKKLSQLTKSLRYNHDLLHPELINNPIVLVAKNHDDEMRAIANKVDAQGLEDLKKGVDSQLAEFHKLRQAEKSAVESSVNKNNLDIEVETLNKMPMNERLNYDKAMAQQKHDEAKNIERQIKDLDKEATYFKQ